MLNVAVEKPNLTPEEVIKTVMTQQNFQAYKNVNETEREHWTGSIEKVRQRLLVGKIIPGKIGRYDPIKYAAKRKRKKEMLEK